MKPDDVEQKLKKFELPSPARTLDRRIAQGLRQEEAHPAPKPISAPTRPGLMAFSALAAAILLTATLAIVATRTAKGPKEIPSPDYDSAAMMPIGEAMPDFTMSDYFGKEHSLSNYDNKIVVLSFGTTKCPWWPGALAGMGRLQSEYAGRGIVFLAVDSDNGDSPDDIADFAQSQAVSYPILKDENRQYADHVKAERTPAMFVVARDGRLAYQGAFDDRDEPDAEPGVNYVALALEELLAGDSVSIARAEPQGCPISPTTSG